LGAATTLLCAMAADILGQEIGQSWHLKFTRHHPDVKAAWPIKLDPKHVKHFNKAIIDDYFDKVKELHAQFDGIPPEHI
jgi:hypothetical protein